MSAALLVFMTSAFSAAGGFYTAIRTLPRMIARMTPEQVDQLAAKVERFRYGKAD